MKECLNCKKEFQPQKDTAKYCSVSCRVMWNRKHGTKKPVSTPQVQVLYNAMLDMMANINVPPAQPKPTPKTMFEPTQPQRPALRRSFENYRQLRAECENEEDWTTLKSEILAADNLTSAQKRLLTT